MGVLDKLKNALFEVEYVEVEEPPKKEKKVKEKRVKERAEEKPIAKKIVLPGKREEKVEELYEEELKDEDFEIRPKDEKVKAREEFKFMDDNDFKMDDVDYASEEPEILHVLDNAKEENEDVAEEYEEEKVEEVKSDYYSEPSYSAPSYSSYSSSHESKPYGLDDSYNVNVHQYGTYDRKEEKNYFRPSPIISPIYGILDKNYKKEDVKEKRDVRITSSYSRSNVSVDDIRNKAYGEKKRLLEEESNANKFEIEEEEDDLLVDLSDKSKPEVKELTMGDAEEYFQDLGLEYNVDYVDTSTDRSSIAKKDKKNQTREEKNKEAQEILDEADSKEIETIEEVPKEIEKVKELLEEEDVKKVEEIEEDIVEEVPEVKEEKVKINRPIYDTEDDDDDIVEEDNDNLFDLIDSMYEENE